MITLNYFVRKNTDVCAGDFKDYWLGDHADRCLSIAPKVGIRNFTKCETRHEDDVNVLLQQLYGTAADAYDFVDQMVINDLDEFKNGMTDADVKAAVAVLHDSEASWVDHSRSDFWFSTEIPQVYSAEHCAATWNNTLLKVFYVPRRLPHLALEEAQLHWSSCHGAMARQFVEFLPYKKYVQGHRTDPELV
ncbi:MAG: EthD domain-containing protein [Gammaproteobacteria bacterium]|jgi:hypothetical protein|nr:EthD domain-containing protein [Gammaproteobacteria bacterium]